MQSTAEQLTRKNQEGLSLLLKLLAQLGMSYKDIAEVLGVSPSLITYWVQSKRRMSVEDQTWCYGTFADAIMTRWPEENEAKQRRLIPIMEQLIATWQEASELAIVEKDEEVHTLLDEYRALQKQQVRDVEGWYRFETANENFRALAQAQHEHNLTLAAWKKAEEVIVKAKEAPGSPSTPARPQPTRPRPPRRPGQRRPRRRAHA
jgi:transcriptional regulator with XRE-family HTH domain